MRILIMGSIDLTNDGLAEWLTELEEVAAVWVEADLPAAMRKTAVLRPDAILLDFEYYDHSNRGTIPRLAALAHRPAVIVLAHRPSPVVHRRCLELGAAFVFDKTSELDTLCRTLISLPRGSQRLEHDQGNVREPR